MKLAIVQDSEGVVLGASILAEDAHLAPLYLACKAKGFGLIVTESVSLVGLTDYVREGHGAFERLVKTLRGKSEPRVKSAIKR